MSKLLFDPSETLLSFDSYQKSDGFKALACVLKMKPEDVIKEIQDSKLVGRGGAGFPVGIKMSSVLSEKDGPKYIVCNADEGEPGTFKDRELLKRNSMKVLESMVIAAYAIGASKGYLYVRGEYNFLKDQILNQLDDMRKNHYLGDDILGSGYDFDIEYRSGIGAYICGEETALIESIEGRSGDPRVKPPYTASKGLWNKPTLIHNVETLINILPIMNYGADYYKQFGTEKSTGTKLFSVSGSIKNKGVYEVPFGTTLNKLLDLCGGPTGRIKFVQIGGSSGIVLSKDQLDIELSHEAFEKINAGLGSGAVYVADESVCIIDFLNATAAFFRHESCGKCTPCREGNRHIEKILASFKEGQGKLEDIDVLLRTSKVMKEASFCGLGQTATSALSSAIEVFKEEFIEHIEGKCRTGVCKIGGLSHES
ncbi:NADH-quinone oxidoreductase subunit F [Acidaminobacter sp. JC074]|uniref:complex I 51 kDa subunit family protein n=1 Tax=Acidaminobacter sp. JC074 TaxID=2530199 RepID=UPI001F1084B8|nr:NADH-ubiquinone oxidoreductase-F iron-sulfur binding region domain-containing protein [Acidaminobacter sp. JC074]MCH4890039.1 NADH-quinone oxidoreductase subunit F [Acidaminobacter sp. JC074]